MTGLGLKLPHGPHRRPMGGFAAFPSPETSSEARAAMARCVRRLQRDSLGAAHRRSLARSARPLSALSNLPSRLPAVAARRDPDETLARPRRRPAGPRQTGFVGDLHRRQLQFGEKRGTADSSAPFFAKLDLSETFIDASFSSAKKGALLSARLAEEKAVKSWRSQTAMVFLSPATLPALRRMKRNSSKAPSNTVSPVLGRNE